MLAVRARLQNAEKLKDYLKKRSLLDKNHTLIRRNLFIYFPIAGKASKKTLRSKDFKEKLVELGASLSKMEFEVARERKERVIPKDGERFSKSYDILGNIAVIDATGSSARALASRIMAENKGVGTVLRKGGPISGKYRTRKHIYVMGRRNYISTYKENGSLFQFDVRKAFFSSRLAFERKRITSISKDGEKVIVMFAGVGPFAIELAKSHRSSHIIAIELNKSACEYMEENIRLNKVGNVIVECGDVRKKAKKYAGFADRVIMPLPMSSMEFLNELNTVAAKACIVHLYSFSGNEEPFRDLKEKVHAFFFSKGRSVKFIGERIVRPYSAREAEVAIDFIIS